MSQETINYLIHFELPVIIGSIMLLLFFTTMIQMKRKDILLFYIVTIFKLIIVNTYNVLTQLDVIDSSGNIIIMPIATFLFFVFADCYCMWKTSLSFLHIQLALVLVEFICLFTITVPVFLLNAILDPAWTTGMNSPFNRINAFVLLFSFIFSLSVYMLSRKRLRMYATIRFKRPAIWYTLIFIYMFISLYGVINLDINNIWLCMLYQLGLLCAGSAIIFTINEMVKRRDARKLYLTHKYLLAENTLLKEYYDTIETEISHSRELCLELQRVRQELLSLASQVDEHSEVHSYIQEIEALLNREIKNGELLLKQ